MAKITEDFVSFEVAQLLKEKGLNMPLNSKDWICCMYDENGNIHWGIYDENWYFRITHQMAMRWLRLMHNIYIDVHLSFAEDPEAYPAVYYVYILDAKSGNSLLEKAANIGELNPLMDISDHNVPINFDSPEDAVEAAIKYTLENLI